MKNSKSAGIPALGRREFLGAGALAVAMVGGAAASASAHHTDEHAAKHDGKSGRVPGIQLYTVRESMQQDLPATLAAIAAIGYKEVECAGYFDVPPGELRRMIEDLGMRSPNSHVDFNAMRTDPVSVIEPAAELGNRWATIAWVPPETRGTVDDWKRWAEALNRAGEVAKGYDMRAAYHNHEFEFEAVGGKLPYDVLLAETDPALVDFELDFFWAAKAGQDIGRILAGSPGRFTMAHIKDMNADGDMVDVGAGQIDFAALLATEAGRRVTHLFVEHDEPADAFRSAAISYGGLERVLKKLGKSA
jgi:sugar phosphate isomerase/epimerase